VAQDASHGQRLIAETLDVLRATLHLSGAMFYWIAPDLDTENDVLLGLPAGLTERYRDEMRPLDPLLAARLVRAGKCVAELRHEATTMPAPAWQRYEAFLDGFGVTGNADFLFWTGEGVTRRAYAGISLVSLGGDPPLTHDPALWSSLHRYIAFTLQSHDRVRQERLREMLRGRIGLTPRECEVCDLVTAGATNRDIAEALGLTLATVKFYMAQIFDKMGVETRTALAARLGALRQH
jgi:DNA-binding CsgD family transcriptional regulator